MRIFHLQILLAIFAYSKILATLYLFGAEGLGLVSYITALITSLSILAQIFNNQAIHVAYIKSSSDEKSACDSAMTAFAILAGGLASLIILVMYAYGIFDFNAVFAVLINCACIGAIWNGIYDFRATVCGDVKRVIISQIVGAAAVLAYAYIVSALSLSSGFLVLAHPVGVLSMFFYYRTSLPLSSFKVRSPRLKNRRLDMWLYLRLQRKSMSLNAIPVASILSDFITKQVFTSAGGLALTGVLQVIQSVDSLIGNIFAGPVYKLALYDFTTVRSSRVVVKILRYSANLALPVGLMACGIWILVSIELPKTIGRIESLELVEVYRSMILLFLGAKYLTLVWGLMGQFMLSEVRNGVVVFGEVSFRVFVAMISVMLVVSVGPSIEHYVYSYVLSSILLFCFGVWVVARQVKYRI